MKALAEEYAVGESGDFVVVGQAMDARRARPSVR